MWMGPPGLPKLMLDMQCYLSLDPFQAVSLVSKSSKRRGEEEGTILCSSQIKRKGPN